MTPLPVEQATLHARLRQHPRGWNLQRAFTVCWAFVLLVGCGSGSGLNNNYNPIRPSSPTGPSNRPQSSGPSGPRPTGPSSPNEPTGPSNDPVHAGPFLRAAERVSFGYKRSGAGSFESAEILVDNHGDEPTTAFSLSIVGDNAELFSVAPSLAALNPQEEARVVINTTLAATGSERIVRSTLRFQNSAQTIDVPIYAAIGDAGLADSSPFQMSTFVTSVKMALPRAPYPQHGDYRSHVYVAVPRELRQTTRVDVLVALHGWGGNLTETLVNKRYPEQAFASNRNAILIVPQGLYEQDADDFGAVRQQDGLRKLIDEALILLFREGLVTHPVAGDVAISGHSGAYWSLAEILTKSGVPMGLRQVTLLDSLYGRSADFAAYANSSAGQLICAHQGGGSTSTNCANLGFQIGAVTTTTGRSEETDLASGAHVVHRATAGHGEMPTEYTNLARYWQFSGLMPRTAPAPVVQRAAVSGGRLSLSLFVEPSLHEHGLIVETSPDGITFSAATEIPTVQLTPDIAIASPNQAYVRVRARYASLGISPPSDTYFVRQNGAKKVVVIDAFDRFITGAFNEPQHDFSARIAAALPSSFAIETCSNEAVERGHCSLSGADLVLLNAGLSSTYDQPINSSLRTVLSSYAASGGKLLVNGAEVAFALKAVDATSFLSGTLKVSASLDDANASTITGVGALATVPAFSLDGAYDVNYPDTATPASGAQALLRYADNSYAAVGNGNVVFVGFPLETVSPGTLSTLLGALVGTLGF